MFKRAIAVAATGLVVVGSGIAAMPSATASTTKGSTGTVAQGLPTSPTDASKVPHYFGPWPNWALSPLTQSTAEVTVNGAGTGATATAVIDPTSGGISGITVDTPGKGYVQGTTTVTIGGASTGQATATASVSTTGGVTGYAVTAGGGGYGELAVAVSGGGGRGAIASPSGGVDAVDIGNGGSGYVMPTVEFSLPDDPAGTVAKAHVDPADLNANGSIAKVTIDDAGSGYTKAPDVAIHNGTLYDPLGGETPPKGLKATLKLVGIDPLVVGTGYTSPPSVTVTDPTGAGSGATATSSVSTGAITNIAVTNPGSGYLTKGIKKFQDQLPLPCSQKAGTCPTGTTPDTKYLPVADLEPVTYSGEPADQVVIGLVQYRSKFSSDLPPALARGYVQIETAANAAYSQHYPLTNELLDGTKVPVKDSSGNQVYGVTPPQWLGPFINATKGRPVRVVFHNYLPTGKNGDLILPTDSSMMGSGMGPMSGMPAPTNDGTVMDQVRNPECTQEPKNAAHCFTDNRALLHLHGGTTPWISDGTPHQWITPANESTPWPQGVAVKEVPDMKDGSGAVMCSATDDGCTTFYYTNQQSARLMFYHDHSWGLTRLNIFLGQAAGYTITDDTEKSLVSTGTIPAAEDTIPLVVQDRTFVPKDTQLYDTKNADGSVKTYGQDPTWDKTRWGGFGNFWYHHVYMPAQNPGDASGMSAYGRWMYGPWFWPPAADTKYGPIDNPYYDPNCKVDVQSTWQYQTDPYCEPQKIPGTPNLSAGMEQFNDTPLVNGVAYPTVTLQPKSYRLRLLNAANDRFFNLQWYQSDPTQGTGQTEVALKPAEVQAAQTDPNVVPTPVDASTDTTNSTKGPDWVQIGNESGFLPTPTVVDGQQPTTWIIDPTRFDVGNVDKHSMLLAPAERSDAIVDFSKFAGKTLILYNDAPAAFPARVATYDYYTGQPDLSPNGAPGVLPGYGPNTRTVMQVKIAPATPAAPFNLTKLTDAFKHNVNGTGVFEKSQHPIIVGQAAYNSAYGSGFPGTGNCSLSPALQQCDGYVRVNDTANFAFNTLRKQTTRQSMKLEPKALHDEMNSVSFDEFGRMTANMGMEASPPTPGNQNVTLFPYVNPPTELIDATKLPNNPMKVTPIADLADGTQIWRITHNGVDTHPIHFHLYDVQLINRVTWDNIVIPNDPSENGWKDVVRVSPLEDTIVALRPVIPVTPFEVPNSVRVLNPMMPLNDASGAGFNSVDVAGNAVPTIVNKLINFGWEYVWHCHILSHEEMDMMRPQAVAVPPFQADRIAYANDGTNATVTWADNSITETQFKVQRSTDGGTTWADAATSDSPLDAANTHGPRTASFAQAAADPDGTMYRIVANNTVGYGGGLPSATAHSESWPLTIGAPADPTGLAFTLGTPAVPGGARDVNLTWTADPAATGQTFSVQRSTNAQFRDAVTVATNLTSPAYTDPAQPQNTTVYYRVMATGANGYNSQWTQVLTVVLPDLTPAAPASLSATASSSWPLTVQLSWPAVSGATGYTVERSASPTFASGVVTVPTTGTGTTATDSASPAFNTTYYYRVRTVNQYALSSTWTTGSLKTPAGTLTAPTSVVASASATATKPSVTVSWAGQPWAASYTVAVSTNRSMRYPSLTSVSAGTLTATLPAPDARTTYYVQVRAEQPGGVKGPWSSAKTVQLTVAGAVRSLSVTSPASGTAQLAWRNPAPAAGRYQVQQWVDGRWQTITATLRPTRLTVRDPGPTHVTYFRVRGRNSVGWGSWTPIRALVR